MANLVLQPTLEDLTIEELEAHIEGVRARRIVAAMEYVAGEAIKLEVEKDKMHRKLKEHYVMLAKELDRCERAIYKCEERVVVIQQLKDEIGVMEDYETE
jgi:RecA/RadA recombinase